MAQAATPRPTAVAGSIRALFSRLLSPEGLADPYAVYEELRERQAGGEDLGRVVVSHAQAQDVLTDRNASSERIDALVERLGPDVRADVAPVIATLHDIVAFRDPPQHTRLRRLMSAALRARAVTAQREVIRAEATALLDEVLGDGDVVDLHGDVTFPLPARVVSGILGIPPAHRHDFEQAANDLVFFVGSGSLDEEIARRALVSVTGVLQLLSELIAARRADPGDDLLSAMIAAEDDGTLTDDEVRANALFLMTAGHETATNMLSNALLTLLRHPEQLTLLREQPDRLESVVEETLRFEPAVQMTPRLAREDGELGGIEVAAGDPVLVLLAAANRDPEVFAEPARFDPDRDELRHVAFGHGPHWCIGGPLAREEARIVLPLVLERMPGLRLADDELTWQPTLNFRGPTRLLVRP